MQPQNFFSYIPQELLIHSATGNPGRFGIRDFIHAFIPLKRTCKELNARIEKICLEVLFEEWRTSPTLANISKEQFVTKLKPPFRFVMNWIEGKPAISETSLLETLGDGFSLKIRDAEKSRILEISKEPCIQVPAFWTSQPGQDIVAFTRASAHGDATFFNIKTGKYIGEILGELDDRLIFTEKIQPIFYEDHIIILFQTPLRDDLAFYEIEESKITFKTKTQLPPCPIRSMRLYNDLLIFEYGYRFFNHISLASIEDLRSARANPYITPNLSWPSSLILKVLGDKVMLFWKDNNGLTCQTMRLKEGELEFSKRQMDGNRIGGLSFREFSPGFYYQDHHAFFLSADMGREYTISAISTEDHALFSPVFALLQNDIAKLVQFKDFVILCSGNRGAALQLQTLEIVNGQIKTTPLAILGIQDYKFNRLDSVHAHLDKLFLMGVHENDNYLVIVNMETKKVESKHLLKLSCSPKMIATALGRLYIFNPGRNNILQIQY